MTTPSITEDAILTALRTFLLGLDLAGAPEVIQGQDNRVPEPAGPDFIVFTPTNRSRIETNIETWDTTAPPGTLNAARGTEITVQLDIHGPNGSDNAQVIASLWRSDYGCRAIDPAIFQPLFASDGHQMPFINAERQYENRWVMSVVLQANPIVSTTMPFADSVDVNIIGTGA